MHVHVIMLYPPLYLPLCEVSLQEDLEYSDHLAECWPLVAVGIPALQHTLAHSVGTVLQWRREECTCTCHETRGINATRILYL